MRREQRLARVEQHGSDRHWPDHSRGHAFQFRSNARGGAFAFRTRRRRVRAACSTRASTLPSRPSTDPSLGITASATAPVPRRRAGADSGPGVLLGETPSDKAVDASTPRGRHHTTMCRTSTRGGSRRGAGTGVDDDSVPVAVRLEAACWNIDPTSGCTMASSRRRSVRCSNTIAASRSRSSPPSGPITRCPERLDDVPEPGVPAATACLANSSGVEHYGAALDEHLATVDLPERCRASVRPAASLAPAGERRDARTRRSWRAPRTPRPWPSASGSGAACGSA
jgi:hypothetical protein